MNNELFWSKEFIIEEGDLNIIANNEVDKETSTFILTCNRYPNFKYSGTYPIEFKDAQNALKGRMLFEIEQRKEYHKNLDKLYESNTIEGS